MTDITKIPFEDKSKAMFIKTGLQELNCMLGGPDCGFALGDVSVWTGQNGSGKSSFISQLALEAVAEGYTVDVFSGELSSGRLKQWLYLQAAGQDGVQRDSYSDFWNVKREMIPVIDQALEGHLYLYPNENGCSFEKVLDCVQRHLSEHPVDVVILDNLMVLDGGFGNDKYDGQIRIMKAVVELARTRNVHVHFICHPKKQSGLISRYDISGSANISDLAANVFSIYRNGPEFASAWELSRPGKPLPAGDNVLQLLKCRWDGMHVGEVLPLYFDVACKVMNTARGGRRNYPWQQYATPEQQMIDLSGEIDPDFPFIDAGGAV